MEWFHLMEWFNPMEWFHLMEWFNIISPIILCSVSAMAYRHVHRYSSKSMVEECVTRVEPCQNFCNYVQRSLNEILRQLEQQTPEHNRDNSFVKTFSALCH